MSHRGRRGLHLAAAALLLSGCARPGNAPQVGQVAPAARPDTTAPRTDVDTTPVRGARFYRSRGWGTERQFNPLSLVVNGGLDQLRTEHADTRVFQLQYGRSFRNVFRSVTNPERVIRRYGWNRFIRNELLPFTGRGSGGGQWVPNYQLHFLGGGMTGVRITEWFTQRGVAHPELAAFGTVYAWHFLTEAIEHGPAEVESADAVADLLIFDLAAFLVWRTDRVQRLVIEHVEMTNWPGQPTLQFPDRTAENVQMTAMLRVRLPRTTNWRAMTTFGSAFLLGVSRAQREGHWISLAAGLDPRDNPIVDPETGQRTVVLAPSAGIFWDRDGSLLASLLVRAGRTEAATLNVHPGVVRIAGYSPGLWAQWLRSRQLRVGLATELGLGVGVGPP